MRAWARLDPRISVSSYLAMWALIATWRALWSRRWERSPDKSLTYWPHPPAVTDTSSFWPKCSQSLGYVEWTVAFIFLLGLLCEVQFLVALSVPRLFLKISSIAWRGTNYCCVPRVRSLHHSLLTKWSSTLTTLMWSVPYSCAPSCWRKVISTSFSVYWLFDLFYSKFKLNMGDYCMTCVIKNVWNGHKRAV